MITKAMAGYIPTEQDMIDGLQPIRTFMLTINIYHLFETGLYDDLIENGPDTVAALADRFDFDADKLEAFLKYLRTEEIIEQSGDRYGLSEQAKLMRYDRSHYTFFVGGYTETFMQVGEKLKKDSGWATRNLRQVAIGSKETQRYDTPPVLRRLISQIPGECTRLLDVGCGNGHALLAVLDMLPEIREAMGVDPGKESCDEAVAEVEAQGMSDRVRIVNMSSTEFIQSDIDYDPHLLILGYVIQEILGQEGRESVVRFISELIDRFPKLHIILMEVDMQWDSPVMQHPYAKAFYNPYYLIHAFTNQKLETLAFWEEIFDECNLEIVTREYLDTTHLIPAYLMRRKA
ncbi:MAG: 2-ketoarginine methyltransferase [Chloroflexota bacterium]